MAQILNRSNNTIHDVPLINYEHFMRGSLKDRVYDFIDDHLLLARATVLMLLVVVIVMCVVVSWFGIFLLLCFLAVVVGAIFWGLACGIVDWIEELLL